MHKKILRIISLALAIMLLASVVPTSVGAADSTEAERITAQIRTLYKRTLQCTGRYSMLGYCGAMVNWHLYLMGITADVVPNDGNTEYDCYSVQDYTTGGYRVRAYSAAEYTLESALNAITYNGTRDAYNILVGFQQTYTTDGRIYGHALVVHAILDGIVYFSESYSTYLGGKYYPEGSPITCTIAEFAAYYAPWSVFEGVVYFGQKTYAESCDYYHAYLYATVQEDTMLYTAPCVPEVDDRSRPVRTLKGGEHVNVTGLYCNTEGEYWYQVDDGQVGYIRAEDAEVLSMRYDDIKISGVAAPTVLLSGKTFALKGKIISNYNEITAVRTQVFASGNDEKAYLMSASTAVSDYGYSLSGSRLCTRLEFNRLEVGGYRYELAVVVGNNYYADGCLQTEWKTVKLWTSEFQVAKVTGESCRITFDANGGSTELNATDVAIGDALTDLPEATREGYVFDGWYTADGQAVTEEYEVSAGTTLYAHWTSASDINGWYVEDDAWYYYVDGCPQTGFLEIDGIGYHLNENGYVDTGLVEVDGLLYYFHTNGAMHHGWLLLDAGQYYFGADGAAAIGWTQINGHTYYFNEQGVMLKGVQQIAGTQFNLGEHGELLDR